MTKTLYLNPNKIDGYWTINIQQKLAECNHDVHFHHAQVEDNPDTKSIWIYGLASIGTSADLYACMKPGSKPGGELETIDMDWSKPDPALGTFLALEFHYGEYEHYEYKKKERVKVEPCGTELGIATLLLNQQKNHGADAAFAITLVLLPFPITLVEPVSQLPLPLDMTQQMTQIVIGSLSKPIEVVDAQLPMFSAPQSRGGGYQKKYKTPSERMTERETAMKDYVVTTFDALGYSKESIEALKEALAVYPLNPLTAETIITVSFAHLPEETRKNETEKLLRLIAFSATLV